LPKGKDHIPYIPHAQMTENSDWNFHTPPHTFVARLLAGHTTMVSDSSIVRVFVQTHGR
jgi:hypothetical protein